MTGLNAAKQASPGRCVRDIMLIQDTLSVIGKTQTIIFINQILTKFMQNLKSAGRKLASAIAFATLLICCNWNGIQAQALTVTGVVTDETGEPLIGT